MFLCWLAPLLIRLVEIETDQGRERLRDEIGQIHRVDLREKRGSSGCSPGSPLSSVTY